MLELSDTVSASLFDRGGVPSQTARVPAAARTQLSDDHLRERVAYRGEAFVPLDLHSDEYIDGEELRMQGATVVVSGLDGS